ncbi:MAG: sugar phosphate isomerase/epimerase family protein [Candidatus Coatesbacteria bacterium]
MRFAVCNEMFKDWAQTGIAARAKALGYDGVELAPFTLSPDPTRMKPSEVREVREAYENAGLDIVGLHWLLARTQGLSITSPDDTVLDRTAGYLRILVSLCSDLGGQLMVFGSPAQRDLASGQSFDDGFARATRVFREVSVAAGAAGISVLIEPLTKVETNFINTMEEGVRLVEAVGHANFRLHLDIKAMRGAEPKSPAETILAEGGRYLHHFHANDPNLLGPGMGDEDIAPIAAALKAVGYDRWISVETFAPGPGPEEIARLSLETLNRHFGGAHAH